MREFGFALGVAYFASGILSRGELSNARYLAVFRQMRVFGKWRRQHRQNDYHCHAHLHNCIFQLLPTAALPMRGRQPVSFRVWLVPKVMPQWRHRLYRVRRKMGSPHTDERTQFYDNRNVKSRCAEKLYLLFSPGLP